MITKTDQKYTAFPSVPMNERQWPSRTIQSAPRWCSVDLRDGNQALINPMSVTQKKEMFDLLVSMGFKEIEVAFPSASQTDYDFVRALIEEQRIPRDVTIQVLTQAREHLIDRTFAAIEGCDQAIVHLYISTSPAQRRMVFSKSKQEITAMAVAGTRQIRQRAAETATDIVFEFSPESFSATELEYSLEICQAVLTEWDNFGNRKPIINLPATVEMAMPNVYADQIEWFMARLTDPAEISVHTHNDRGCAVAAAELALLAGARRVEGTLFGNGERTGNVDIVTMALNLYSQGIDPELHIDSISDIARVYSDTTGMSIHPRHPYAGELVYTAFSGSHQDAISKGLKGYSENKGIWDVPYLAIDPEDIGRSYEGVIRINSQSGKGGVAYILENNFGYVLPKAMHPEISAQVQKICDASGKEITPEMVWSVFSHEYLDQTGPLKLRDFQVNRHYDQHRTTVIADIEISGKAYSFEKSGNGILDALSHALAEQVGPFKILAFHEHAVEGGSDAIGAAYIQIENESGKQVFGAGRDSDITVASANALVSALNRLNNGGNL